MGSRRDATLSHTRRIDLRGVCTQYPEVLEVPSWRQDSRRSVRRICFPLSELNDWDLFWASRPTPMELESGRAASPTLQLLSRSRSRFFFSFSLGLVVTPASQEST